MIKIAGTAKDNFIISTRKSGIQDSIPTNLTLQNGEQYLLIGEFRSQNTPDRHVKLFVDVAGIFPYTEDMNEIEITGYICKSPNYRYTPSGKRITDIILASTHDYDPTDYIPCIAWNNIADEAAKLHIGDRVTITGRVQSRKYHENKTAYEVSVEELRRSFER